jgi:hypothetical protein
MICPDCNSLECRRSHREGVKDFLIGVSGLRPWRCRDCQTRFFAWSVPIAFVRYAHCDRCGNLDVKRISSEFVPGTFAWFLRALSLPAYRCPPCRNKFFSIRRHLRLVPAARTQAAPESESPAKPENKSERARGTESRATHETEPQAATESESAAQRA